VEELAADPSQLPPDTVVVRGGVMTAEKLASSALAHYRDCGVYALSVWAIPGLTAEDITRAAVEQGEDYLPHNQMQTSTVGAVAEGGYGLVPTGPEGHFSLMLPDPPGAADWEAIMQAFGDPRENPCARSRRPC
jgi:hypothetical protein